MKIYIYIDNVRASYDYLRQFEYISALCDEYSTRNPVFFLLFFFFKLPLPKFLQLQKPRLLMISK